MLTLNVVGILWINNVENGYVQMQVFYYKNMKIVKNWIPIVLQLVMDVLKLINVINTLINKHV